MKQFLNNRAAALLLSALVILGSLTFGVHRSVTRKAEAVAAMYETGVDGSGYGIAGDAADRIESAEVLCKLASRYPEIDASALEQAITDASAAGGPAAQFRADCALDGAFRQVDLALQNGAISEKDEKYRSEYAARFVSSGLTMDREAARYNAEVRLLEKKVLGGLPVKLFGWLAGLPEVEAFQ